MRRIAMPALCLLLLSCAQAQQPAELVRVTGSQDQDLGLQPIKTTASRRVRLENAADIPLVIELAGKSCGCVSVTIDPPRIAPGEGSLIRFGTVVENLAGAQTHGITLRVKPENPAPGDTREQDLTFTMTFAPDVDYTIAPPLIVTRGVLGERLRLRAFVQDITDGALKVGPVTSDLPEARAAIERTPAPPRDPDTPFDYFAVAVDFTPRTLGTTKGHIFIETNSLTSPKMAVPVTIKTVSAWKSSEPGFIMTNGGGAPEFSGSFSARLTPPVEERGRSVAVRIEPVLDGSRATLRPDATGDGCTLELSVDRAALTPASWQGAVLVEDHGAVVLSLPIVWIDTAEK